MCFLDLDPCTLWDRRQPTARKEHRCDCCRRLIPVGQRYVTLFYVFEGESGYERCCEACDTAIAEFAEAHDHISCTPASFLDVLAECIAEDDESRTRWRPLLERLTAHQR